MDGSDPHCAPAGRPRGPLLSFPYALYCLDGGTWGLLQGGRSHIASVIRWQKLRSEAESSVPSLPKAFPVPRNRDDSVLQEARKDELHAAILRLRQEFGFTNENTYDFVRQVVDSISEDPFAG